MSKSATIVRVEPLLLRRDSAAAVMGISVSLFEAGVRKGHYPKPRLISGGTTGWLLTELQACAYALPISDLPPGPGKKVTPDVLPAA